jgi:hypothetical protein
MKIRTGFVSNSSSASFVVTRKSTGKIVYSGEAGYDMVSECGEGDSLECIVTGIIDGLGFDVEDFEIKIGD